MKEQGDVSLPESCPHCGGDELYCRRIPTGPHSPLLQGLGSFLHFAEFDVVVCAGCGLTRLFAEPEARHNAKTNKGWKRL